MRNDCCVWSESRSRSVAREWVSGMPGRWQHLSAVGRLAECVRAQTPGVSSAVVSAAWVHDIGYSAALVDTGMHAIDGARALQRFGAPSEVVALVAHHTGASFEAEERELANALLLFPHPDPEALDELTLLDLVVGPTGDLMSPAHRIEEILSRYGREEAVHRAVTRSAP